MFGVDRFDAILPHGHVFAMLVSVVVMNYKNDLASSAKSKTWVTKLKRSCSSTRSRCTMKDLLIKAIEYFLDTEPVSVAFDDPEPMYAPGMLKFTPLFLKIFPIFWTTAEYTFLICKQKRRHVLRPFTHKNSSCSVLHLAQERIPTRSCKKPAKEIRRSSSFHTSLDGKNPTETAPKKHLGAQIFKEVQAPQRCTKILHRRMVWFFLFNLQLLFFFCGDKTSVAVGLHV